MSMSVTDRYTQSQTRLHNSVTALDTATAHWRRNAANAHLAATAKIQQATHADAVAIKVVKYDTLRPLASMREKLLYDAEVAVNNGDFVFFLMDKKKNGIQQSLIVQGISPWISIFLGMIVSGVAAVLIGIPMLRLSGHYFAIATLLIGISFQVIFQRWEWVGAASGVWVPMTSGDSLLALQFHSSKMPYYYIFLVFFIITFFLVWLLSRSKLGYRLRAVRDDPQAALSLCINVSNYKIIAYVISAMIMAPMGSLFAQYILIIDPDRVFNIEISIIVLLITVLGGIGNVWGPIVGAAILIPISEYSRIYLGGTGGAVDLILYGLILMLICIFRPEGLISFFPKNILERKKQR